MQNVEAPVEVNREFNPLVIAQYEFLWQYYDRTGNHSLAFENQVLAVKHQFNFLEDEATRVVELIRPNPNGPPDHKKSISQCQEWMASYGVDEAELRPLWEKRAETFKLLDEKNPDWINFKEGLLEYYEGLKEVISAKPAAT